MNSALRSLTAAWSWTTVDVLNHLWQSTVVGVVVLAVLLFARGLSARTRWALGWMALIKFALPASILVHAFARLGATPSRWVESGALAGPIMLPAFVVTAPAGDGPARVSIGLVLTVVWLTGFVGLFISWLVRGRTLRRQIFTEVHPVSSVVEQRIVAAARRAGAREAPRCLTVGSERAPGVLGVFAPVVILPRGLEATLAPAELESVLIHEFVHVQRRDNLWGALQAWCVSLFWFHPVVWWLNRRIGIETEQSCDERVLEITGDSDSYAGGIVKAVQHALGVAQPGLIGATTPPVITRIKNIFSHGARRDQPLVRGAALAGGALLLAFSGYSGSFAAPALAPTVSVPATPAVAPVSVATPLAAAAPAPAPVAPAAETTLSVDLPVVKIVAAGSLGGTGEPKTAPATEDRVTLSPAEALPFLVAQADRLKQKAEALEGPLTADKATPSSGAGGKMEAEAAAAAYAAVDARRQAVELLATATGDADQLAELAAQREAEVLRQHALAAKDRTKQQNLISLEVVNERLEPSNQKMLPTGEVVSLHPAAAESAPAPEPVVEEIGGRKVYDISQLDQAPSPRSQARPDYPLALRRSNVSGEATIDFIVDANGAVVNAHPVKSTHKEFAEAAVTAVSKWKFRPGRKEGVAVPTHMQVPIVFTLNENN